jgi:uncharacterized membrane protein
VRGARGRRPLVNSLPVGTLLFSGWNWLTPAAVLLCAALLALFWAYRRAPASPGVQAICWILKFVGITALLLCLLEPLWSGQRARPGANYFAVVADNSQGMQIRDQGESRSRGDQLREILTTDQRSWQGKLEEMFQVRRYLFDSRLQFTKNFSDLDFNGRASTIGGALRAVADRYQGQPLAGILLFTDGNATDLSEGISKLTGLPPVYPVVMGSDRPITDIALQKVAVTQTAFEDAPVSIQADVTTTGFGGQDIVAQLVEIPTQEEKAASLNAPRTNSPPAPDGTPGNPPEKIVASLTQRARREEDTIAFRFQIRPEKSGIDFYRVRVSAKENLEQFDNPDRSPEATLANNSRVVAVDRGRGPYRVLYVAGRPNWEYKFLHRAIDEDDQVQLDAMIRVARREPKMAFLGRTGESSNPLFRGFGNQNKEDVEQYDQPVVRWLVAQDNGEVHTGFPKTPEELYRYHAVIIDDLEAEFFTRDQMMLLQHFVSERGGGFLMLGGQESFHEGGYDHTPIGEMLPVYVDNATRYAPPDGYHINLTREGWLQPWARVKNNEADEKERLSNTPPFQVLNQVREFKPGASVIATVSEANGQTYPALVVQRFGNGRTAALTIGDFWHWGFRDKEQHRDMDKAWRQMVRWLVSDVPNRIELQADQKPTDPNQAVLLQVRVRDEKFQPVDSATVAITVQPVGQAGPSRVPAAGGTSTTRKTSPIRITAEPASSEPGLYQATFIPREAGGYRAEAIVANPTGAELGRAAAGWSSDPAADEFRSLKPNRALMEEIAKKTGGEVIPINKLESFARTLPQRRVPITESWTFPLWHQPVVFLFALGCFILEWGIRRWKGLA